MNTLFSIEFFSCVQNEAPVFEHVEWDEIEIKVVMLPVAILILCPVL